MKIREDIVSIQEFKIYSAGEKGEELLERVKHYFSKGWRITQDNTKISKGTKGTVYINGTLTLKKEII